MVKKTIITAIAFTSLLLVFCTNTDVSSSSGEASFSTSVRWMRNGVTVSPDEVDSIRLTITSPEMNEVRTKTFSFSDHGGSFAGIPAGITITLKVEGLDASSNVIYSGIIEDIALGTENIDISVEAELVSPKSPSDISAIAKSSKTIQLTWTDNSSNEDGFILYRSNSGGDYDTLATLSADDESYNDTGLTVSSTYSYMIFAFNSAGVSRDSVVSQSVSTLAEGINSAPYFITDVKNSLVFDTVKVGDTYKKAITANDDDGDDITYEVDVKLSKSSDTVTWSLSIADTGIQDLWVKVTDSANGSDSIGWQIFVEDSTAKLAAPEITKDPEDSSVTEGDGVSFSVDVSGEDIQYQWQKEGSDINGANSSEFIISSASYSDSGSTYRCIVSNSGGADTSNSATLHVNKNNSVAAPNITSDPSNVTVSEGDSTAFTVAVEGDGVAYQWQKNNSNINGAISATYKISSVNHSDSGFIYRCIVSNSAGKDTSSGALLKVNLIAPSITTDPTNQTATEGQNATFTVVASGTNQSCQWQCDGSDITGATGSNYTKDIVTYADSGKTYRCIVSNSGGKDTSNNATLTVNLIAPSVTTDPSSQTATEGQSATFTVAASGTNRSYQWQCDGSNISGATASSYSEDTVTYSDSGKTYRCIVSNSGGKDTSSNATLTVNLIAPSITTDPSSQSIYVDSSVTFTVTGSGTNLSYQWQRSGSDIAGATSATYTKTGTPKSYDGSLFRCIVSNSGGSDTSEAATLTVEYPDGAIVTSFQDQDGNNYNAIKIGDQIWSISNFRCTRYNDGSTIPLILTDTTWEVYNSGAYCYYDNNASNLSTYGALYNWHAVNSGKLAPTGWHVPTEEEWLELVNYMIANGYNYDGTTSTNKIGKALADKTGWDSGTNEGAVGNNPSANNSSNFTGKPGGQRLNSGTFVFMGAIGYWWTATSIDATDARGKTLNYNINYLLGANTDKNAGYSIRLVKDD